MQIALLSYYVFLALFAEGIVSGDENCKLRTERGSATWENGKMVENDDTVFIERPLVDEESVPKNNLESQETIVKSDKWYFENSFWKLLKGQTFAFLLVFAFFAARRIISSG
jgi:hypothetical protein